MKLSRRNDIEPHETLGRLAPSLVGAELIEIGEGWDNVAYAVGGSRTPGMVLRISKFADPAERAATVAKDAALLDVVAAHASLAVNTVLERDIERGVLLLSLVPGVSADRLPPDDVEAAARAMGEFLTGIHAAVAPPGLVTPDRDLDGWHAETCAEFAVAQSLFTIGDRRAIETFLAEPVPSRPARLFFCHNDLGDEHVIIDPETRAVAGVIDWSDAVLDDPARDFALLLFDFGLMFFERSLAAYGGGVDTSFGARARWFAARAGVAGVARRALDRDPGLDATMRRLRGVLDYRG